MKLNSQQTTALACLLANEINTKNQKADELAAAKFKKDNESKLKKGLLELEKLKTQAKKLSKDFYLHTLETLILVNSNSLSLRNKFKSKPHVHSDIIKQELILATIEATDLEQIKSFIIKKFS
jgi:hypothetical protein